MALLCAAYGWTPAQVRDLTPTQVQYFASHLPDVHYRLAYPFASLEATILNMMGGKPDPNEETDEPPKPPELLWSPDERLAWYAMPDWVRRGMHKGIPAAAARDFLKHMRQLPAWVLHLAPIDAIRRAAEKEGLDA